MKLKLRRIPCKTVLGLQVKTEIISATVNSQQVSMAVKGLHNALSPSRNATTGRVMALLTRLMDNIGQQKYEKCMTDHLAIVQYEQKIYMTPSRSTSEVAEKPVVEVAKRLVDYFVVIGKGDLVADQDCKSL